MLSYAHDFRRGVLVTRHLPGGGGIGRAIAELGTVVRAFDAAPAIFPTKIHLLIIDPHAPLPDLADRHALSDISKNVASPTWFACVPGTVKARLVMDIIYLLAPPQAHRQVRSFDTVYDAIIWLGSVRPDAVPQLRSLAGSSLPFVPRKTA